MRGLKIVVVAIVFFGLSSIAPLSAQEIGQGDSSTSGTVGAGVSAQKWALLIGVDDYAEIGDQRYCARDVEDLQTWMIAAGFPISNVFLLNDNARLPKYLPWKANIERQFELIPALSGKGDLLVLAFCGHAVHLDGKSYLCPMEAQPQAPEKTMVSLDYIYRQLALSQAEHKLLLIDVARNAGGVAGNTAAEFLQSLKKPPQGIFVLMSCRPDEVSLEDETLKRGVFMQYVLKGIEGEADGDGGNRDGQISLGELCNYVGSKTTSYAANTGSGNQTPTWYGKLPMDLQIATVPQYAPDTAAYPTIGDDLGEASARLEAITRINPQSLNAYNRALEAYGHGDIVEAIEYCTDSLRRDPGNIWAYILRASCYCSYGSFSEAVEDYRKLGIPLPCRVAAETTQLKVEDEVIATLSLGDKLYVTEADDEWLWGELAGDGTKEGWVYQEDVE